MSGTKPRPRVIPTPMTAMKPIEFFPVSLQLPEMAEKDWPSLIIQVPTPIEREQLMGRLLSLGLRSIGQDEIRATMIDELFRIDWGKGSDEANEAEAEELANFLDEIWQKGEIHDAALERWQAQEAERLLDEAGGAPQARPYSDAREAVVDPHDIEIAVAPGGSHEPIAAVAGSAIARDDVQSPERNCSPRACRFAG